MSTSNMVNILRAMAINTVFGIAATITMARMDDMSAGTLASCSAYVFVSAYLWLGQSLGMSIYLYSGNSGYVPADHVPDSCVQDSGYACHLRPDVCPSGNRTVVYRRRRRLHRHEDFLGAAPNAYRAFQNHFQPSDAPWIIIIMLGCVLVAYLFLNFTKHGRYLYAMGGNKEAAKAVRY